MYERISSPLPARLHGHPPHFGRSPPPRAPRCLILGVVGLREARRAEHHRGRSMHCMRAAPSSLPSPSPSASAERKTSLGGVAQWSPRSHCATPSPSLVPKRSMLPSQPVPPGSAAITNQSDSLSLVGGLVLPESGARGHPWLSSHHHAVAPSPPRSRALRGIFRRLLPVGSLV